MSDTAPVVVGVDGSPAGRGVLWWAVHEALLRNRALTVVTCPTAATHRPEEAAEIVDEALHYARNFAPALDITAVVGDHAAGRELSERSSGAELVVVGSRGLGGFAGLLLGSVSGYVASHAACPVLIVHDGQRWAGPDIPAPSTAPVAVGVGTDRDPAGGHDATLAAAWEEAALRGVDVLAVRAWQPPHPPWRSDVRPLTADVAELEAAERNDLADVVEPWRQKYPIIAVRQRLTADSAAGAIVEATAHAQLVVVGTGRHRGFVLGSVAHQVLLHAACPVLVIRHGA